MGKFQRTIVPLDWYGPYGVVEGAALPDIRSSKNAILKSPGVYLWSFLIGTVDWIHYVGKAEENLLKRARTEFREKDASLHDVCDMDLMLQGKRLPMYSPGYSGKRGPDKKSWNMSPTLFSLHSARFFQEMRVWVAPMDIYRAWIRNAEAMLIWKIWEYELETWSGTEDDYHYLSNGSNGPKKPQLFDLQMKMPKAFRGL